jgi:ribosome-binding factor A
MPREYPRTARINVQLQAELSALLRSKLLRDPRLSAIDLTVTSVEVAQDMGSARIMISSLGEESALKEAVKVLNGAAAKLRHELGRRLRLRYTPELSFRADEVLRQADRINQLLRDALNTDRRSTVARGDKPE